MLVGWFIRPVRHVYNCCRLQRRLVQSTLFILEKTIVCISSRETSFCPNQFNLRRLFRRVFGQCFKSITDFIITWFFLSFFLELWTKICGSFKDLLLSSHKLTADDFSASLRGFSMTALNEFKFFFSMVVRASRALCFSGWPFSLFFCAESSTLFSFKLWFATD